MSANSSALAARPAFLKNNLFAILCAVTVSLSAFLLFLLEPLFAKMILPWFGGSAAVWATCLVFFQSALLLGYYYADVTSRKLSPRKQIVVHLVILLLALFFIPIAPGMRWRPLPGDNPFGHILGLLTFAIGIPYTLLSTTSPLVQAWYARCRPGKDAYYLFSLSNLASFLALLSYPFVIEPVFATHLQAAFWSALFVLFVAVCAVTAWVSRNGEAIIPLKASNSEPPSLARKLHWLALAACGSMLLLTITNHLTQNVAPVPLLWVLPLALYLLSFTLVFSRRGFYNQWLFIRLLAVFLGAIGYVLYDTRGLSAIQISVPLFCIGLFVACMFCHGELNRRRPDEAHLTLFYLMLSVGAALGAIFVGLIAPHIFDNLYEFPLTLLVTAVLALVTFWSGGWSARALWGCVTVAMAIVLVMNVRAYRRNSFVMVRNFYGALRVTETSEFGGHKARVLFHGTIRHGAQYELLPWRKQPTTYYSLDSGIGLALRYCCPGPKRVGIIGLGAGTIAAYGNAGDYLHFYEINPAVINIANSVFTYLRESPARKEITLGDARLSLENEPPQNFDVLAVDAFSGDAIPVHLLTKEAIALYFRHLKPNGILAIHTSNTYLRLNPVVKQLAENAGYEARSVKNESDDDQFIATAEWVLATRNRAFWNSDIMQKDSDDIDVPRGLRLWTDDYNNLFQILKPVTLRPATPD
ncbi:MAG TPA: fused MFS/spermidine synthase [Bryobacteraceae bacterium]|nr:fused MFS/spermidine synthase [Bryobacteraceae bacterium]